jgi:ubiquinone biosynthesis protein COQ9
VGAQTTMLLRAPLRSTRLLHAPTVLASRLAAGRMTRFTVVPSELQRRAYGSKAPIDGDAVAEGESKAAAGEAAGVPQTEKRAPLTDAELRARVLESALLEVATQGWTTGALAAGAAACGLSPMAHGLVLRGPIELVEHFHIKCDSEVSAELAARREELAGLEVHNRLLVAMQARLLKVGTYRSSWAQALALRALPANLPNTLRDAHATAVLLLDACGEDAKVPLLPGAVDPYVKLMSIGAIYGAAELHLLTDSSADLSDTWTFLEREVEALRTMARGTTSLPDISPSGLVLSLLMRR